MIFSNYIHKVFITIDSTLLLIFIWRQFMWSTEHVLHYNKQQAAQINHCDLWLAKLLFMLMDHG